MRRSIAAAMMLLPLFQFPTLANGDNISATGESDYRTYCASCHGREAKGDGPVAEFLALVPADLTQLTKRNGGMFPGARVAEIIDGRALVKTHGSRDMPVWGDWFKLEAGSPEIKDSTRESMVQSRIRGLASYLQSIQEQ